MKLIFGDTDKGLVRMTNQDAFIIKTLSERLMFAVLCDGMGGENGGNIASSMAVEYAGSALSRELNEDMSEASMRAVLFSVISGANALVYGAALKDETLTGMGTTMILAVFLRETLYVACVGDSRVYCVSPQKELQLTRDHTVVQMLIDIGEITPEEAKTHPKRHFITRAVGVASAVDADFIVYELMEDDIVLICSDGLYNYLEDEIIYGFLEHCVDNGDVTALIDLAKDGGGTDNITAIVCGGR